MEAENILQIITLKWNSNLNTSLMRKLLIFLSIIALFFTSCSDDDDASSNISASQLQKKWYYVSYTFNGFTMPYDHMDCDRDYIELLSGGIAKDTYVVECTEPITYDTATGTWSLNGNSITVTFNEPELYVITGTITNITDTTLQISAQEDIDDDGTMETIIVNFTTI